jgi:UDP-GlcNAc:undecaprenyl-phosphate GlcNAc-1-phosphate transferase
MLMGFSIAWMMVVLSQEPATPVAPVTMLWFAALPIYDMVSTGVGRALRGQSPMSADNTHLHHLLLKKGYSTRTTLVILVAFALLWALVGAALDVVSVIPEWLSLVGFLMAGVGTVLILTALPFTDPRA